jgi:hypothetical protein
VERGLAEEMDCWIDHGIYHASSLQVVPGCNLRVKAALIGKHQEEAV